MAHTKIRKRLASLSVRSLLTIIITILFVATSVLVIALVHHNMREQALAEAEEKLRLVLDRNMAVHTYFSQVLKPNVFAWTDGYRDDEYFDPSWMSSTFAVRMMDDYFEEFSPADYFYKDAAVNARSPENEADAEERAFLEDLAADPSLQGRSAVRTIDGEPYLVVLRPGEVLEESCLRCHGSPADAPADLVAAYGPERGFHRQAELGGVISAVSVRVPLAVAFERADRVSMQLTAILLTLLALVFATVYWLPRRLVFDPLDALRRKALEISHDEARLGERVPEPFGPELSSLARAFNAMSANLLAGREQLEVRVEARTAELARSTAALREREHLLREAQTIGSMGSYVLDIATGMWTSSETLDAIFGIAEDHVRSVEGWLDLVHPDDRPTMAEYLHEEIIGRGRPFDKEYRIVRRTDGTERWVHGRGRLELAGHGRPAKMLGTIQDITERKRAEEAVRRSEERLLQSQRMEAVGNLAGGIAHDFNNLLTVMIGQAQMLHADPALTEEHRRGLEEIHVVAGRAAALTRQLLAFSRRQALQPRVLDLDEVARSMTGMLERLLGEDIELVYRADPEPWPVEADPGQMEQVILNLALNARDAMPHGGTLTIETTKMDVEADDPDGVPGPRPDGAPGARTGPHVVLTISDTGCGIEEENISRIFEPFFTTKEPGKGTGLGLATVYGIVKQSGGDISVESAPGRGAAFRVYLPRATGPVDWTPGSERPSDETRRQGSETILVVEDEPALRSLAVRILKSGGYRVVEAGSAGEARAAVDAHDGPIHLIVSDVVLPGESGPAFVDTLLPALDPRPRVLYMTGYARDAIIHQGKLDEGIELLEKPFAPEGLLRKVRELLDG